MKFVSYNIQYGFGLDGHYDLSRAADVIRDADVIALQEVERFWQRTGEDDQVAILAGLLPDHYWVYGPAFDMDASYRDEAGRLVNRRRQFGTMLMSRTPILWSRLHCLPKRRVASRQLNTQNPALEGLITTSWGPVRVLSLHLAHLTPEERLEQLAFLHGLHRRAPFEGGPWSGTDDESARNWSNDESEPAMPLAAIWMGDFNATPDSAEYRMMVGAGDHYGEVGKVTYADGFADSWLLAGHNADDDFTFPVHHGREARRIDYCFVSGEIAPRVRRAWIDTDENASDHKPVWVEIEL